MKFNEDCQNSIILELELELVRMEKKLNRIQLAIVAAIPFIAVAVGYALFSIINGAAS